jgi:transcriptional regulator GlxA family with amidase domain
MMDFVILLLPQASPSSVANTLDIISAAAVVGPRVGLAAPRWQVVSPDGGPVALSNGFTVMTQPLPARRPAGLPAWVVPGHGVTDARRAEEMLSDDGAQRALTSLRRAMAGGSCVAASCSGVLVLAEAGLLQGRRATIAWWLAPLLRRRAPGTHVDEMRMVIEDGPVVTAGAAMAQIDLMLWLLRRRFGQAMSTAVARVLLLDGRQSQAPYIDPGILNANHELLARIEAHVRATLPAAPSVQAISQALAMSPRTLARQVRAASGRSPLALIQAVRLSRARGLLEGGSLSVEEVAQHVGYTDSTALRRLLRKNWGIAPRQVAGV